MRNLWILELDLSDGVGSGNRNEADCDAEENTHDHAQRRESSRQTQAADGDGLDHREYSQALPSQLMELGIVFQLSCGFQIRSIHIL